MTQQAFEEQFPSLEGFKLNKSLNIDVDYDLFSSTDIQQHCLDKQKVRDAIRTLQDVASSREVDNYTNTEKALVAIKKFLEKELGL